MVAVCLAAAAAFLTAMLAETDGALAVPLDDSYIYFQYARETAAGRFLQYNGDGEATTGATGLLYVLLLAPYFWVGASGGVIGYALGIGVLGLAASGLLVTRIAGATGRPWGLLAGLLFACNGYVLWGYLSGMEIALFGTALLALVWVFLRRGRVEFGWAGAALGSAVALSRPEGVVVMVLVFGLVLIETAWHRERSIRWRPLLLAGVPVAVGLAQFLLYAGLTGSAQLSGMPAKGLLYEPGMTAGAFAAAVCKGLARVVLGDIGGRMVPCAGLVVAVAALGAGVVYEVRARRLAMHAVAATCLIGGIGATCAIAEPYLHMNRYQMPFVGLLLVYLVVGLHWLFALARARWSARACRRAVALVAVVLLAASGQTAWSMRSRYARHCGEIQGQHVRIARVIGRTLPPDALICTHDVGAIRFVGRRRVHDLIGLVSGNDPRTGRHGYASMFEELESLPAGHRPTHFALYPAWVPFERFRLARPIASARLARPEMALPELTLYEADWSLGQSGHHVTGPALAAELRGLTCVDRMDVADVASEREHGYRVDAPLGTDLPKTFMAMHGNLSGPVVDGGRRVLLAESWTASVRPGRDAVIVMRTVPGSSPGLSVRASTLEPVSVAMPPGQESWAEWVLMRVPGERLIDSELPVETRPAPGRWFSSFHYWVYQKR